MKPTRSILWGLVAGATIVAAYEGVAWAQTGDEAPMQAHEHHHGGHGGDMHGGFGSGPGEMFGGFGPALKQLNLTDAQRQSVHNIMAAEHPQMQKMHEQMHTMLQTFETTLPDDPNYATVVAQATTQSQEMAAQMVKHMSDVRSQVYELLTADQKKQLPGILKSIAAERAQMHEKMRAKWDAEHAKD
jgi:Spy/CpxP family protein refolding chaperone